MDSQRDLLLVPHLSDNETSGGTRTANLAH